MEWRELQPANPQAAPMKKAALAGISYGSIIVTVGGYGHLPTNRHPGVEYVPDPKREGLGWTNEVVCYDTEQSECTCICTITCTCDHSIIYMTLYFLIKLDTVDFYCLV